MTAPKNAFYSAPGRALERLVAMLETALASTGATIESPCRRLIDRETGESREHDVIITWDHGHHRIVTAIECRDRSRPVGVPEVEAFYDKCVATGVQGRVIVSANGFRRTARRKAAAKSITCMDIQEVAKFEWLATDAFVEFKRDFNAVNIQVMFKDAMPESISSIYDGEGRQLSESDIMQIAVNSVPHSCHPDLEVGIEVPVFIRLMVEGWTAIGPRGETWQVEHLLVDSSYRTTKKVSEFTAHRYLGGGKEYAIASAEALLGEQRGRVMLVRHDDDTTSVIWAPDNHGIKSTRRQA